jgi:hypothetical protein
MLEVAEMLGERRLDGCLAKELGAQAVPHGDRLDRGPQVPDYLDAAAAAVDGLVALDEVGGRRDEHQRWWRVEAGKPSQLVIEDGQQLVEPRPAPDALTHQIAKVAAAQLWLGAVEPQGAAERPLRLVAGEWVVLVVAVDAAGCLPQPLAGGLDEFWGADDGAGDDGRVPVIAE